MLRYRVIFYGEPKDENQKVKTIPDSESLEARWVSLPELQELDLRGDDLLQWGKYLEKGGEIFPIDFFKERLDF